METALISVSIGIIIFLVIIYLIRKRNEASIDLIFKSLEQCNKKSESLSKKTSLTKKGDMNLGAKKDEMHK